MDFDQRIENNSYASVASSPMLDRDGRDVLVVVAKVGYLVDARGQLKLEAAPVRFSDELDEGGGLSRPNDLADVKPGVDVGLVGTAYPRGGAQPRAIAWLDVGGSRHSVTLIGERRYALRRGVVEANQPAPIGPTPLRWDLAFGGTDRSDPDAPAALPENPIGVGFAKDPQTLVGQPAPRILGPDGAEGAPAGFAPIPPSWQPRASRFGTLDETWARTRAPVWPRDARPDRWSWSAPGLHRKSLSGAIPVEVGGVRPEGTWKFVLPDYGVDFSWRQDGETRTHHPHLDGVLIDADVGLVELSFRVAIRLPRKWQRVERIHVHSTRDLPDAVLGLPLGLPPGIRSEVA